jgi:hypothetical protein
MELIVLLTNRATDLKETNRMLLNSATQKVISWNYELNHINVNRFKFPGSNFMKSNHTATQIHLISPKVKLKREISEQAQVI